MNALFCKIDVADYTKLNYDKILYGFNKCLMRYLQCHELQRMKKLIRLFVFTRDIQHGKGFYELSYHMLFSLMTATYHGINPKLLNKKQYYSIVRKMVEVGSWKDMKNYLKLLEESEDPFFICFDKETILREHIREIIVPQLVADRKAMSVDESPSYCAKWVPREKSRQHGDLGRKIAREYAKHTFPHITRHQDQYRMYRRLVSSLNTYLDTVEIHMTQNKWEKINFDYVPIKAQITHHRALSNYYGKSNQIRVDCAERYSNHLYHSQINSNDNYIYRTLDFHDRYEYYVPCFLTNDPECFNIGYQMMQKSMLKFGFSHHEQPRLITPDMSQSAVYELPVSKSLSFANMHYTLMNECKKMGITSRTMKKIKLVIISKFSIQHAVFDSMDDYERKRNPVYPDYISMIKNHYRKNGYTNVPRTVFWDIRHHADLIQTKKYYSIILDIRGFFPHAFKHPLHTKWLSKDMYISASLYQTKYDEIIASIYKN